MRLYNDVLRAYLSEDDFVYVGEGENLPPLENQNTLNQKKQAIQTKIAQAIANFKFTDNVYNEKNVLSVLIAALHSLDPLNSNLYIGSKELSGRFDQNEVACKNSAGVEALVREAILCNIIQDNLDLKPTSPNSRDANTAYNSAINDRKNKGANCDFTESVNAGFEIYLVNESKKMAIRVRSLHERKDEKKSSPDKMALLKAANALFDNTPPNGYTAKNLAAYNYALDQYKPELRQQRGKAQEKGMFSFLNERTDNLIGDIEILVHKWVIYSPIDTNSHEAYYCDAMTKDLQTQVQALLADKLNKDQEAFTAPPDQSKMNLLYAAQLLLNECNELKIGSYLRYLTEYKRLNKPLVGPIFEERTEALIRKIDGFIKVRSQLANNRQALTEYNALPKSVIISSSNRLVNTGNNNVDFIVRGTQLDKK